MRVLLFGLCIACSSMEPPPPADMAVDHDAACAPIVTVDMAARSDIPVCLPPGAPCDPLKPPPCCDGIACPDSGKCLTYNPVK